MIQTSGIVRRQQYTIIKQRHLF